MEVVVRSINTRRYELAMKNAKASNLVTLAIRGNVSTFKLNLQHHTTSIIPILNANDYIFPNYAYLLKVNS